MLKLFNMMTQKSLKTITTICVLISIAWVVFEMRRTKPDLPEAPDRLHQDISGLVENPSPFEEEDDKLRQQLKAEQNATVPVQSREWKGQHSGVTMFRTVVVKSPQEWQVLWTEHTNYIIPPPPAPDVDFDQSMVVGIFAGTKPSAGYGVTIVDVSARPGKVVVSYQETNPPAGMATPAVITQPYDLKVIGAASLPVTFERLSLESGVSEGHKR
jgi:PrcB C-terminal